MISRRSILAACTALTFATPLAAHADTLQAIKQRGQITVGIDFTHPPYGMLDDKSEQVGSDFETAKLLAADLGVKLNAIPVTGPNRIPFLLTNKVDIVIASFSVSDERKKVISFSRAYATEPLVLMAPASLKISGPADLAGKTIAAARGNTADIELTRITEDVPGVEIMRYVDEATARSAIVSGQQSIFGASIADANTVKAAEPKLQLEVKFIMATDPVAIGLRHDDPALQAWMDDWIAANLKNGKLSAIYQKYFGIALPADLGG
jgi:polar amino acid transport system substrate-binding protein